MKLIYTCFIICLGIAGCDMLSSTQDKQLKACIADVKLGLNDPNSLEILNSDGFTLDNGWFRIDLKFTAKNAMGGRVRGETLCGFASKNDLELNKEDIVNQERTVARFLKSLNK